MNVLSERANKITTDALRSLLLRQSATGINPFLLLRCQGTSEFRSEAEIIDWLKDVKEAAEEEGDNNEAESVFKRFSLSFKRFFISNSLLQSLINY